MLYANLDSKHFWVN